MCLLAKFFQGSSCKAKSLSINVNNLPKFNSEIKKLVFHVSLPIMDIMAIVQGYTGSPLVFAMNESCSIIQFKLLRFAHCT